MSQENVEIVRRFYEELSHDRIPYDLIDPGVELDLSQRVFNPAVYRGYEGVVQFQREIEEVWESWATEADELMDFGDEVLAFVTSRGRGKGSGVEVEDRGANLWTLRDGKVVRYRLIRDRDEALRAAGGSG